MEYKTDDTIALDAIMTQSNPNGKFYKIMAVELLLVFLSLVESYHVNTLEKKYTPGLFNGGIIQLFKDIFNGSFFGDIDKLTILITAVLLAILNLGMIGIAIYKRESARTKKYIYVYTIFFGITLTKLMQLATHNYVFMFITMTYVSGMYLFYIKFGEVKSFFENRVIIFSLRRSLAIIPMFLAISLFTFFALNVVADPVGLAIARIRYGKEVIRDTLLFRFGLEDRDGNPIPAWKRYLYWIYEFIHGDFGESYDRYPLPVTDGISLKLYLTLKLQIIALVLAFILSLVIGILAAYFHKTPADSAISAIALLGLSMPIFVSGILAILIFGGLGLNWFPTFGANYAPEIMVTKSCGLACRRLPAEIWEEDFTSKSITDRPWLDFTWWGILAKALWYYWLDGIYHIILPVATLTFATMATFARLTRGTMLDVMKQDYILAARANGLTEYSIIRNHALKNVLLPLVTFLGISIGALLAGAPITETIFTYPGLGSYFIASLNSNDVPIIMALTMIITLMILFSNLLADVAYTYLDPRITL